MSNQSHEPHEPQASVIDYLRLWWVKLTIRAGLAAIGLGLVLSLWMARQTDLTLTEIPQIREGKDRITAYRELAQYQVDSQVKIWTAVVQAAGVVVLAVGGYFTWRTVRVGLANLLVAEKNLGIAQDNYQATLRKLDIDRDGQITNRYTQAVSQLGAELKDGTPNLEVRLGGIYALERIAQESERDHGTIMELLTAYVRRNSPWPPSLEAGMGPPEIDDLSLTADPVPPSPRFDIQAILTVLGRRRVPAEWAGIARLNLSWTDLRGVNLIDANLDQADLRGARFQWADMRGVSLKKALLQEARLSHANLRGEAHLEGADLTEARLKLTRLNGAHLEGAVLSEARLLGTFLDDAHLEGATFDDATPFMARFIRAHMEGATFVGTVMDEVRLGGAYLEGADFSQAIRLTREQLARAFEGGRGAILPAELSDQSDTVSEQPADGGE